MPASVYAREQTKFLNWPTPPAPVFVAAQNSLLDQIKADDQLLTFHTRHLGRPEDVTSIPLYKVHDERYSVYWKVLTESEWKAGHDN